jgi:LacI family transcriptional regulator, purine nucleotide synthesis repressor
MVVDHANTTPLYVQLADVLRKEIATGVLPVGEKLGSIRDLARKHDVSVITVKGALRQLTDEGLIVSRPRRGTFVIGASRAETPTLMTNVIGMVLTDIGSPFFSLVVRSAEQYARTHGYSILLGTASEAHDDENAQIMYFHRMGVVGLLVGSLTHKYVLPEALRQLSLSGFPYVMISYVNEPGAYLVCGDSERGGFLAAKHLLQLGYRKLGNIDGEQGNLPGELRRDGYLRALRESGRKEDPNHHFRLSRGGEKHDFASGYEIGRSIAGMQDRPDALFAYNDLAALGAMQALLDAGLDIPEDVGIVGFDDIERSAYAPVPLTTIRQPTQAIGQKAIELLLARIHGKSVPLRTILETELVPRSSTAPHGAGAMAGSGHHPMNTMDDR